MTQRNLPWKPVVKVVAFVAAREAGVFLYRLAINRVETDGLKAKVRKKLDALRRGLRMGAQGQPGRGHTERSGSGRTQPEKPSCPAQRAGRKRQIHPETQQPEGR